MDFEEIDSLQTKDTKIPDQKELERELSEYLSKKYGERVKIVSPLVFPKPYVEAPEDQSELKRDKITSIDFSLKPEELEAYLDEYVIKQEDAKAILATKICTHFNRIKYAQETGRDGRSDTVGMIKNNIILLGPTGVGKTYIIKLIAQKLGVPFVKGDATKFSETGYVGGDVEDLVRDLVYEAQDDIELAQYGIIYIDEIDKIASSHNLIGPDVSRSGVQRALLKLMEETEVDLKVAHDPISQIQAIEQYRKTGKREKRTVNTRHILFIVSGAFSGLNELIRERLTQQNIGFCGAVEARTIDPDTMKQVKTEDFIKYGFESEFIGRLPVSAVFDELKAEDLYDILRNPNNPIIISKKRDFEAYGINVRFEDSALRKLAQMGYEEKTGARGLVSAVERVLVRFEKKLPSTNIKELLVTEEIVENPVAELQSLLNNAEDPERRRRLQETIDFDREYLRNYLQIKKDHLTRLHGVELDDFTIDLIAEIHLRLGEDVNRAVEDIVTMQKQIKSYESAFMQRYGFSIEFDREAFAEIVKKAIEEGSSAYKVCEDMSKEFEYAFRLIKERTGEREFLLSGEAVRDTQMYLNNLIKRYYSEKNYEPTSE
jgi:ATP-dependent Clp protease ATP-binding subunit ClpX